MIHSLGGSSLRSWRSSSPSSDSTGALRTPAQRDSSEKAVHAGQEILDREKDDLATGRGTAADVAEASQRQEQFNLDLVTRTSDVITTEREFRNVLGLPQADNRRIVLATDPTAELVDFDWEICLGEMMYQRPDIVLHKLAVNELQPAVNVPAPAQRQAAGSGRESSKIKDDVAREPAKNAAGHVATTRSRANSRTCPIVPGGRRRLQAVPDGKTPARRRSGASMPSEPITNNAVSR